MNDREVIQLLREIRELRVRVATMEKRQVTELSALRVELNSLEEKLGQSAHGIEAEAPATVLFEEAEAIPAILPKAEVEALPAAVSKAQGPPPFPATVPQFRRIETPASEPGFEPAEEDVEKSGSFELRFGRVWLVRFGIALLVTGLVLLGNFAYKNWIHDLPAGVRLAALYIGSLLLSGAGVRLAARDNLKRFGEVLLAGGMAFFYWCTFASHHVERLRVIDSPGLAGLMLLGAAGAIVAVSLRRESRVTAVMGLLLASYSTVLQPLGWMSCASNLVLAMAGTSLMLRPGWAMPGIASMAGTYAAFFWWQIAGAMGRGPEDPAALWFLPPVWAVFALPGVFGISERFSGMSERARSIHASANNWAFFLLFSMVWQEQMNRADYWMVPAIFGAVLIALGAAGRSRDATGGSHLAQGLAALTLAMALKLEGYQLPLALAIQSLALALAFARFGGKSELAFSVVGAVLATGLALQASTDGSDLPTWSFGLTALLITAAAFPLRKGCNRFDPKGDLWKAARGATAVVFIAGSAVAMAGWCLDLSDDWKAPAVAAIGVGLTAYTLLKDHARRMQETGFVALAFLGVGLCLELLPTLHAPAWSPVLVSLLCLGGHWLWMKRPLPGPLPAHDLISQPKVFAWLTALTVTVAIHRMILPLNLQVLGHMLAFGGAAIAVAALGRWVMSSRILIVAATLLLPEAVRSQLEGNTQPWLTEFIPLLASLAVVAVALLPRKDGLAPGGAIIARCCAVISWFLAWQELGSSPWGDIMAASGAALLAGSFRFSRKAVPESWVLLGAGVTWLLGRAIYMPWGIVSPPPVAHGWLVVACCFAAAFLSRAVVGKISQYNLFAGASALLALWSSQVLVWHFDLKPVVILWTGLGFLLVSAGLWQKVAALRHAGFALLAIAVAKLFVLDVWDFNTFTRIAAFLALGVALVVLGFFYNRFADVLKRLLEPDEA